MKKSCVLLLVLSLLLVLTGCSETTISCGVDREMNAYLNLEFCCDWGDVSPEEQNNLVTGFEILARHYKDKLGFAVEETYTDTGCALKVSKVCPAESYAEAFRALERMLSDTGITPFVEAHTELQTHDEIEGYALSVVLDAGNVLGNLGIENFPGDLQQYFRQSIEESSARIALALPASELIDGTKGAVCQDGMASVSAEVDLNGQTTVSLATLALLQDGQVVLNPQPLMESEMNRLAGQTQILRGILLGTGLLLLVVVALLLWHRRKSAGQSVPSVDAVETEEGEAMGKMTQEEEPLQQKEMLPQSDAQTESQTSVNDENTTG